MNVPLLELKEQYASIREEIMAAVDVAGAVPEPEQGTGRGDREEGRGGWEGGKHERARTQATRPGTHGRYTAVALQKAGFSEQSADCRLFPAMLSDQLLLLPRSVLVRPVHEASS